MSDLPDFSKMTQQDFFTWLDDALGEGWSCGLVSQLIPGMWRVQLHDAGEYELGWRKCIEAPTLEEAVQAAIEFTHKTTVEEYQNWYFENVPEDSDFDYIKAP